MLLLLVFLPLIGFVNTLEYYGNFAGSFESNQNQVQGDIYLINSTHLQVVNYHATTDDLADKPFIIFLSGNNKRFKPKIYEYLTSNDGDWLKPQNTIGSTGRFVVNAGSDVQMKHFGVVNRNGIIVAQVNLNKNPPKPFCCFEREADMGLFGEYGIISDPIEVLDARTLKVPNFSYEASKTPDGYFFTGTSDEIDQKTGKKAMIIGRDSPNRICAIRDDITNKDMVIRLDENQTIYDIEWLSVYCYQYSHDFGHIDLGLAEDEELVPPYIPDIRQFEPIYQPVQQC